MMNRRGPDCPQEMLKPGVGAPGIQTSHHKVTHILALSLPVTRGSTPQAPTSASVVSYRHVRAGGDR